jgi:hypothetical protein
MTEFFDPFHQWLGIPSKDQPPNHYRLLGLELFEAISTAIEHAADHQMAHLRTFQAGKHGSMSQRLLNEVAAAKVCLLSPQARAAYDQRLRLALTMRDETQAANPQVNRPRNHVVFLKMGASGLLVVLGLTLALVTLRPKPVTVSVSPGHEASAPPAMAMPAATDPDTITPPPEPKKTSEPDQPLKAVASNEPRSQPHHEIELRAG